MVKGGGGILRRMRGGGKGLFFLMIVLICTTFVLWAWQKTPFLATFLPPKDATHLSSEIVVVEPPVVNSASSEQQLDVSKDTNLIGKSNGNSSYSPTTAVLGEEVVPTVAETETKDALAVPNVPKRQTKDAEIIPNVAEIEAKEAEIVRTVAETETKDAKTVPTVAETDTKDAQIVSTVAESEANDNEVLEVEKNGTIESSTMGAQADRMLNWSIEEKNLKQKEQDLNQVASVGSTNTRSSAWEQDGGNLTTLLENQDCNFAKGKWVVDNRRPLYSGAGCKQWLAPMWACRLMQRVDFAYEKLRWQPKDCQMEKFKGSTFLKRMRGKTLAFVGDSLGRQQFQSLMCMITGGKERNDVIDAGKEYEFVKPHGGIRPSGWAYRFPSTNTTVLYYWSASLCDLKPINVTDPATDYAMHLDRPPEFLRRFLHKIDVLVLNTGHHWNRGKLNANRWVMYVGGKPNTNKKLAMIGNAKNLTIHSIVNWVNSQLPKYPHLKAFYRSISPRHFVNGDWNTGGSCDNTTPMSIGKEVLQNESCDYSAGSAVKGTGVKLLDITALSQLRDEGHISRYSLTSSAGGQDCLHWCLPGVPDTWNEILFAQISAKSLVQKE